MDVETTFRSSFASPFDFTYSSPTESAYASGSSRLLEFSPDPLSSIWVEESKEANKDTTTGFASVKEAASPSPPSSAGDVNEEKSMASTAAAGRESSSPPSAGSMGTTSVSSVSSSLETSALDLGANNSLFGDSVWSSKGSFNDLGSFGSTEEERRYLAEGNKGYLKPPGSAAGSNSSATWGSFWSDLSPSLSPSNSETNLQHFGSPSALQQQQLGNPFSTWTSASAAANRRSVPPNSSPFSSGSVSPISRKQLSPNITGSSAIPNGLCCSGPSHQQPQQPQQAFNRHHVGFHPAQPNANYHARNHHQQYRRSASHPNNGHLLHHHNSPNHQYYAMNNGFDAGCSNNFYTPHNQHNESGFSGGWNMEPANSINGYHQDSRNYQQPQLPGGATMNGLESMKYQCFEPHVNDGMRVNGWDDTGKGKSFFGSFASYDGSQTGPYSDSLLDPFDQMVPVSGSPMASRMSPRNGNSSSEFGNDHGHIYSRKVFVGGLPPDIDEEEITTSFRRFGPLIVDWPHKAESKSYFPPKGYAFLLFQDESSVQTLMDASVQEGDKIYFYVSSPTNKDKPVQVRPWRLTDNECYLDAQSKLDARLTVFVGGVPRPLRAQELAVLMNQRFGYVAYAGIDVDSELKYPKGAGRITFSNQQSYIAAINARFVQLQTGEIDKRVELKPYVLDDQICDFCHGMKCSGRSAPLFCSQVGCLAYLCEHCWTPYHSSPGKEHHKPVTKESSVDRSRPAAMRW